MIRIPAREDGQWTVRQSNEKLPDIVATRNLDFDKEGYLRVSDPVISFGSDTDDADFGMPILFYRFQNGAGDYGVLTDEKQFGVDMYNSGNGGTVTLTESTATNAPVNTGTTHDAGASYFGGVVAYANPTDDYVYSQTPTSLTTGWAQNTGTAAFLTSGAYQGVIHNIASNTLLVSETSAVEQMNTSYADTGIKLSLPQNYEVTGVAYNNNYIGVTMRHKYDHKGAFYAWDAKTTAANQAVELPSAGCYAPVGYKDTFVFISSTGILYYWTGTGVEILAALPSYYNKATLSTDVGDFVRNTSITTEGSRIYINVPSQYTSEDRDGKIYDTNQPAGVWCYDPNIGLYHRHAPTGTKVVVDTVATADVNTSTDVITVTTAYEDGTPVRYSAVGGTAIGGLTDGELYYSIYVSGTTMKLATSYDNAIAGTAIDLTGTGNANQTLQFYPKTDFGNSYTTGQSGAVFVEEDTTNTGVYIGRFLFGTTCAKNTTTEQDVGDYLLPDTENRGYFVTAKMQSRGLRESWDKLFIKHSELTDGVDKIVVKYRVDDNNPVTSIKKSTDGAITWSDSDTFTTTDTQWANVQAGDEVEVIQGTGAGYLLHVSSISEAGGTYTVNLDEQVKNLTASDTGRAVVSRWNKLTTIDSDSVTNDDGYSEIQVGEKSKNIQFKVELRGQDVEIEEILIAHSLLKPVA